MIRIVFIGTMIAFLGVLFILPSVFPADRFVQQIRVEHELNSEYWGEGKAVRALAMTFAWRGDERVETEVPAATGARMATGPMDVLAGARFDDVRVRLFRNQYMSSIDAMMTLLIYRACCLLLVLPVLVVFMSACMADGLVVRWVRSRELRPPNPEVYASFGALGVLVLCGSLIVFLFPLTLHPIALLTPPMLIGVFSSGAVANYHARI